MKKRYNYIRKKLAEGSRQAMALLALSLLLLFFCILSSVRMAGEGPMLLGAVGISSFCSAAASLYYAMQALRQRDRSLLPARICALTAAALLFLWTALAFLGLRG